MIISEKDVLELIEVLKFDHTRLGAMFREYSAENKTQGADFINGQGTAINRIIPMIERMLLKKKSKETDE